jgi:hypothetical protein
MCFSLPVCQLTLDDHVIVNKRNNAFSDKEKNTKAGLTASIWTSQTKGIAK